MVKVNCYNRYALHKISVCVYNIFFEITEKTFPMNYIYSNRYKVWVACLENWDTLHKVSFVLKKGGCTVDVFCSKDSWLVFNSYYDNWIECSNNIETYKQELTALACNKNAAYDWVIPGDEKLLKVMNDYVKNGEAFCKILPLTKIENREILASKAGLSVLCDKYFILSPKYVVYNHETQYTVESLSLHYPVLLKQNLSRNGGGFFLWYQDPLRAALETANRKYSFVIQEFITGKDIGIEALFHNGELMDYNASEVAKYAETKFSFTTRRDYFNSKKIEAELIKIGKCFGINGFASIQYIYQPEKDLYFLLEVDIRPTIWLSLGRFTGHDFSESVRKMTDSNYSINKSDIALNENQKTEVAHFYRDSIRYFKQKDIKGIFQWLTNHKHYRRYVPIYDPVLLRRILKELFIKKLTKTIGKIFNRPERKRIKR